MYGTVSCVISNKPRILSPHPSPKSSRFRDLRTLQLSLRSFFASRRLFSATCGLFLQNTRGGGTPTLPRRASLPSSYAPRGASIPCGLTRLRILPVTTGLPAVVGVYESVWQLCCLGEFLVISMIHLHSSEVVARGGLDFLCAGYF